MFDSQKSSNLPSILYRLGKTHDLVEGKYVIQENEGTEFIWAYPDLRLIVFKIAGGDGEAIYVHINMDNPNEIKRLIATYPKQYSFIESHLFHWPVLSLAAFRPRDQVKQPFDNLVFAERSCFRRSFS
jgi:hypothetical protein